MKPLKMFNWVYLFC